MTEQVIIPINYIERKPNSRKYRIAGKGVTVEFLPQFINDAEWPVDRICENYGLTPAEVYAVWAFYFDHKAEIDRTIAESQTSYTPEDQARRERLLKRYEEKTGHPIATMAKSDSAQEILLKVN